MCPSDNSDGDSLSKTVGIVATYVSNNSLPASELPDLIASVHASLCRLSQAPVTAPAPVPSAPAVPIKKSVTREYVVCLEDGKRFKSLRRHLSSFHDMTPEQYRAKWDLASDYPMVAPAYSETRSRLAKDSGLGLAGKETEASAPATPPAAPAGPAAAPARKPGRGRPKKSS